MIVIKIDIGQPLLHSMTEYSILQKSGLTKENKGKNLMSGMLH